MKYSNYPPLCINQAIWNNDLFGYRNLYHDCYPDRSMLNVCLPVPHVSTLAPAVPGHAALEHIPDKRSASVKENDSSPAKPQYKQLDIFV